MAAYTQRARGFVMKFLVTGLESGCTRITSKLIAINLNIIDSIDDWNAFDSIENKDNLVCHKSIPHGIEDNFIDLDFANTFDVVIISVRDWNCSLISKIRNHEHDYNKTLDQHYLGVKIMKTILENHRNCHTFSPESAYLLQESYTKKFLKSLGFISPKHIDFKNMNEKYLLGANNDL